MIASIGVQQCLNEGPAHEIAKNAYQRTSLPNSSGRDLESYESLS